jgi:tetratricopeptide (TPR) repeat protein
MSEVFISYRHVDSSTWCQRLSAHLALRFGDDKIFRDLDDLKPGIRWRPAIDAALRGARVVLILIGPRWLTSTQRRRLADPDDVLRQEVELSLRGARRKVVPVLVGGARMPRREALPLRLRPLCDWQACALRDRRWRQDVAQLVERLRELMPELGLGAINEIYDQLVTEQKRYFDALNRSPSRALGVAQATLKTLNRVGPRHPQDVYLQITRGYTHKNIAMALVRLRRQRQADAALEQAENTFRVAIAERPRDAGAWNGLGSVEAVRGHLPQALKFVRKALAIEPTYPEALADKASILARMPQ